MADEAEVTQTTGDTNQVEGETTVTSPSDDKTSGADAGGTTTTEGEGEKYVPYSRFKEVIDGRKELEAKIEAFEARLNADTKKVETDPAVEAAKAKLRELGYVTHDDVKAELKQLQEDAALERTLSSLENRYSGKDGLPKFDRKKAIKYAIENHIADPELAYKALNEKEILNYHIQKALGKTTSVETETSNGSGKAEPGPSNDDLTKKMAEGDRDALNTVIRRSSLFKSMIGK